MVQEDFLPCGGILDNKKHLAGHVFSGSFVLISSFIFTLNVLFLFSSKKEKLHIYIGFSTKSKFPLLQQNF